MKKLHVTVDIVLFTIRDRQLHLLLIRRLAKPYEDRYALPGGFVLKSESLDAAAARELREETGVEGVYLEQLYTFGAPERDPRGRVVTVAYCALVPNTQVLQAGTDAADAAWFPVAKLPALAFDHRRSWGTPINAFATNSPTPTSASNSCRKNSPSPSCNPSTKPSSARASTNATSTAKPYKGQS
jgi:ADP-ribose pyrophosphatase YjhB (NUDIX family)